MYSRLGLDGVMFGMAILAAAGVTMMYWMLRHLLQVHVVLAVGAAWLLWLIWGDEVSLLRPRMFQTLGLLVVLYCLESWRRGRRRTMLWLPPFFVLWANVHGSFVYGIAVCLLFLVTEAVRAWVHRRTDDENRQRLKALALYVGACVLATFVSATHYHTYALAFRFLGFKMEWEPHIFEWQPWYINSRAVGGVIVVGLFLALCLGRKPVSMFWTVALADTFWCALTHRRFVPMFAVVALPVIAAQLQSWTAHLEETLAWLGPGARWRQWMRRTILAPGLTGAPAYGFVVGLATLAAGVAVVPVLPHGRTIANSTGRGDYPIGIARTVAKYGVPGRMLNHYGAGAYLIFRLWPQQRVFVDGRSDLYGDRILLDASDAISGKDNWRELLDQYGVTFVIAPDDAGVAPKLDADPDWILARATGGHRLYLKRCELNEPVLRRMKADGLRLTSSSGP